jgi:hypothetical protein
VYLSHVFAMNSGQNIDQMSIHKALSARGLIGRHI